MFTGSPVKSDKNILEVIGKKLKKNNVVLDIVDLVNKLVLFSNMLRKFPDSLNAVIKLLN
jgi:hypothetical protein